ncbi:MAG: hypothetical protein ACHQFW_03225 [Chitinophagales bacterium]
MAIIFSILMSLGIFSHPVKHNQNFGTNGNTYDQTNDSNAYRWDDDIVR